MTQEIWSKRPFKFTGRVITKFPERLGKPRAGDLAFVRRRAKVVMQRHMGRTLNRMLKTDFAPVRALRMLVPEVSGRLRESAAIIGGRNDVLASFATDYTFYIVFRRPIRGKRRVQAVTDAFVRSRVMSDLLKEVMNEVSREAMRTLQFTTVAGERRSAVNGQRGIVSPRYTQEAAKSMAAALVGPILAAFVAGLSGQSSRSTITTGSGLNLVVSLAVGARGASDRNRLRRSDGGAVPRYGARARSGQSQSPSASYSLDVWIFGEKLGNVRVKT